MRYAHTTIIVSDIEKSIQFYEEVAGLTIRNKFSAGSKTLAFLSDKDGDTQIELIQDENEKTYSGSGISIGFEVENVEEDVYKRQGVYYEKNIKNISYIAVYNDDYDYIIIRL